MGVDPDEVPRTGNFLLAELAALPGHLVWRAQARVVWVLRDTLPPTTDIHAYAVLLALADGRPRSQQELAESVAVSGTTMTRVAGDLVRSGLVERIRNPRDRRSYALTRTPGGVAQLAAWEPEVRFAAEAVAGPFTSQERDLLGDLLRRLLGHRLAVDVPEELDTSLGFLITRLHFDLHSEFLAALAPLDVEPRHLGSITALRARGPISQVELSRTMGLSGPTVVQIADELETRGLVERRRSPTDRRTQLLHLLPRADEILAEAQQIQAAHFGRRFESFSAAEVETLMALLVRLVTHPRD